MILLPDAHTIAHRTSVSGCADKGPEVGVQLPSKPLVAYWMLVKPMDQLYTVAGEQLVTGFRNSPEQEQGRRGSCVWRLRFALWHPRQLSPHDACF